MWKMVKNDGKYPSIHPSGNHPIIFFHFCFRRERERHGEVAEYIAPNCLSGACWNSSLAEQNFFPELCSSPILAVNGSGMNPEDIPEYLGGTHFRTNNSITCRHVEKFQKNKKIEENKFVTKTQHLLNCLTILYFPIWNPSRLINYLTYVCWSCPWHSPVVQSCFLINLGVLITFDGRSAVVILFRKKDRIQSQLSRFGDIFGTWSIC